MGKQKAKQEEVKEYFLDQDNDCHWYLVPQTIRKEWDAWCDLDPDDEASWEVPEGAIELGGHPNGVVFSNYRFED